MEIDPVCGMLVDPETTEHWTEYEGTRYYFCSSGCPQGSPEDPGEDV